MFIHNVLRPFKQMVNPLKRIKNREYTNLPIYIFLLTCTSKWFIEGLIDQTILTVVFLALGLGLIVLKKGINFQKESAIWLIYSGVMMFSVLISGGGFNVWGRALIFVLIVLYAILSSYQDFNLNKVIKFLVFLAMFYAVFIFIQYLFTKGFNNLYLPLLSDTTRQRATLYSRRGYYFGLHTSPHEVAGILAFAIAALIIRFLFIDNKKKQINLLILAAVLMFALFLTGKKGVLFALIGAMALIVVIIYGSKKQWKQVAIGVGFLALTILLLIVVARLAYDVPVFHRLNEFIDEVLSGEAITSGRAELYQHAVNLWKEKPLFGVGWYQFISLSTTKLGYSVAHQVNLDYLQWLCETGVLGLILNLIPVILTLYQAVFFGIKGLVNIKETDKKCLVLFMIFVQIFIVAYAFLEIPFYDSYFFGIYILSCMVVNGVYAQEVATTRRVSSFVSLAKLKSLLIGEGRLKKSR